MMQFPQIDILRAYAAVSVLIFHVVAILGWSEFPQSGPLSWFHVGGVGVDLFFVISGFVISLSAFSRIDKDETRFRYAFIRQRILRIAPLHYLTCVIVVIFIYPDILFQKSFTNNAVFHALFIHNLSERFHGAINGVNWSIGVEMQFYILMLILAPRLRLMRPLLIAVFMLAIAWGWRYYYMYHTNITGQFGVYPRFWAITQLPGMVDEFAAGILLARFIRSELGRAVIATGQRHAWLVAIITIGMSWPTFMFIHAYNTSLWTSVEMSVFGRSFLALIWLWLIFAACCFNGRIALLVTAPLRYLGTISYGIYLWHLPVIVTLHLRLNWLDGQHGLLYVIVLTFGLAVVSWHFFEKPFMDRAKEKQRARERNLDLGVLIDRYNTDASEDKKIGLRATFLRKGVLPRRGELGGLGTGHSA